MLNMENNEALEKLRETLKSCIKVRLPKARATMTLEQKEVLAELKKYGLDRTQGSLSQIERGIRLPSVEMLYVLASYLQTSTDYLLGLTDNELSAADIQEEIATGRGEGKIDKLMNRLSREQRQQVVNFAEYLLAQSGRAEEIARNNEAGFEAALNTIQRKYDEDVVDDLLDTLTDNFPDLAKLVGPVTPPKHKRINKS